MTEQNLHLTWDGDKAAFAKAFVAAQMATEAVKKAASNPHFKSKYADLSEVVEATVPALNANGIAVIQSPGFDGDLVSVTTMLIHESGATVTGTLRMRPTKNDPQGVGSAITYGRRYSLLAMTGAAPEDDDGSAASASPQASAKLSPEQVLALQSDLVSVGADVPAFLNLFKVSRVEEINAADLPRAKAMIEAKRKKNAPAPMDEAA